MEVSFWDGHQPDLRGKGQKNIRENVDEVLPKRDCKVILRTVSVVPEGVTF